MAERTPTLGTKRCSRCKKNQRVDQFCIDRCRKDGLSVWCRSCKAKAYKRQAKRVEKFRRFGEQMQFELGIKQCACCRVAKLKSDFRIDRNRKDGLMVYCRTCADSKTRHHYQWSERARQKRKSTNRRWRREHLEYYAARSRAQRQSNPEAARAQVIAWRKANPEKVRAQSRAWRAANPDAFKLYRATRRARETAASVVPFTAEELSQRWTYYGNKCWICRETATATDHVKPLAKGGAHMLSNLRPICTPCNSAKRDKWPFTVEVAA